MDHDGRIDVPCAARGAGERSERSSGGGVLPRFLLGFLVVPEGFAALGGAFLPIPGIAASAAILFVLLG